MTGCKGTSDSMAPPVDPFASIRKVDDPVLAAHIGEAALKRAREILDETPFPPEVLARIAAVLGPVDVGEP